MCVCVFVILWFGFYVYGLWIGLGWCCDNFDVVVVVLVNVECGIGVELLWFYGWLCGDFCFVGIWVCCCFFWCVVGWVYCCVVFGFIRWCYWWMFWFGIEWFVVGGYFYYIVCCGWCCVICCVVVWGIFVINYWSWFVWFGCFEWVYF